MNLEAISLPAAVSASTLVSLCHLEALQVQLDPSFVQTFPWLPPNTVTMKVLTVGYKAWPLFSAASPTQTLPLLGLDYLPNPPRATPSDSSGLNSKAPLGTSLGAQGLTPHCQCRALRFNPWSGNWVPPALTKAWCSQIKKENKKSKLTSSDGDARQTRMASLASLSTFLNSQKFRT